MSTSLKDMGSALSKQEEALKELGVFLNCTDEMISKTLSDAVLINLRSKLFAIPKKTILDFVQTLTEAQQKRYPILEKRLDGLDELKKEKDKPTTPPPAPVASGGYFSAAFNAVGLGFLAGGSPQNAVVPPVVSTAPAIPESPVNSNNNTLTPTPKPKDDEDDWIHADMDLVKKESKDEYERQQKEKQEAEARARTEELLAVEAKQREEEEEEAKRLLEETERKELEAKQQQEAREQVEREERLALEARRQQEAREQVEREERLALEARQQQEAREQVEREERLGRERIDASRIEAEQLKQRQSELQAKAVAHYGLNFLNLLSAHQKAEVTAAFEKGGDPGAHISVNTKRILFTDV